MVQIWRDIYVTLGAGASARFRIQADGATLYEGVAYKRPGAEQIEIRINDICADYMSRIVPRILSKGFTPDTMLKTFVVQKYVSTWTTIQTFDILNDWSYDDIRTNCLSEPIHKVIPRGMPILYSTLSTEAIPLLYTMANGETIASSIVIGYGGDFSGDFNDDFGTAARISTGGTAVIEVLDPSFVAVTIGNITYNLVADCGDSFVLCYANAFGGWDTLPLTSVVRRSERYDRQLIQRAYNNRVISNRETYNIKNEVAVEWELHTPLLTDAESKKMPHILGSPCVFLYSDEWGFRPVTLTGDYDGKTYRNNELKPVSYTINATLAQSRQRR